MLVYSPAGLFISFFLSSSRESDTGEICYRNELFFLFRKSFIFKFIISGIALRNLSRILTLTHQMVTERTQRKAPSRKHSPVRTQCAAKQLVRCGTVGGSYFVKHINISVISFLVDFFFVVFRSHYIVDNVFMNKIFVALRRAWTWREWSAVAGCYPFSHSGVKAYTRG